MKLHILYYTIPFNNIQVVQNKDKLYIGLSVYFLLKRKKTESFVENVVTFSLKTIDCWFPFLV